MGGCSTQRDLHLSMRGEGQRGIRDSHDRGTPYGWGGEARGRDCSRFLMDVFETFGVELPRFSAFQSLAGSFSVDVSGVESERERELLIDAAARRGVARALRTRNTCHGNHNTQRQIIAQHIGARAATTSSSAPRWVCYQRFGRSCSRRCLRAFVRSHLYSKACFLL